MSREYRSNPQSREECNAHTRIFFDGVALEREKGRRQSRTYHRLLEREYRFWVPEGERVLEIGCATGELLRGVKPSLGVGIDLSPEMIRVALQRHDSEHLHFLTGDLSEVSLPTETFDTIILSDLFAYLYDIRSLLSRLMPLCHPRTRIVMNTHSRVWEPALGLAAKLGLVSRRNLLNWVTPEDIESFLALAGFELVTTSRRILLPVPIPLISSFCNRVLLHIWPFTNLCVTNVLVARPDCEPEGRDELGVSVVVACRNEEGNIPNIVERLPLMGARTELIFVEGGSSDETYEACLKAKQNNPDHTIQVHQQTGTGKGDAVRLGFDQANEEVLMILDADMTVAPEDLPQFFEALTSGRVEFVNGSRLVYTMDQKAMRFLNLLGNKFFAFAFSFLLGQRLKDTLCGTKVLLKSDYEKIKANRSYFGEIDPFGDFDLIFGAAKLGLKIVDLPIRYRDRVYGDTNISRFSHGFLLLKMCWLALKRLKCR